MITKKLLITLYNWEHELRSPYMCTRLLDLVYKYMSLFISKVRTSLQNPVFCTLLLTLNMGNKGILSFYTL